MGETVREHAEIQGFFERMFHAQDLIYDAEHGRPLEQPVVHYGHARYQPCSHPQQ